MHLSQTNKKVGDFFLATPTGSEVIATRNKTVHGLSFLTCTCDLPVLWHTWSQHYCDHLSRRNFWYLVKKQNGGQFNFFTYLKIDSKCCHFHLECFPAQITPQECASSEYEHFHMTKVAGLHSAPLWWLNVFLVILTSHFFGVFWNTSSEPSIRSASYWM